MPDVHLSEVCLRDANNAHCCLLGLMPRAAGSFLRVSGTARHLLTLQRASLCTCRLKGCSKRRTGFLRQGATCAPRDRAANLTPQGTVYRQACAQQLWAVMMDDRTKRFHYPSSVGRYWGLTVPHSQCENCLYAHKEGRDQRNKSQDSILGFMHRCCSSGTIFCMGSHWHIHSIANPFSMSFHPQWPATLFDERSGTMSGVSQLIGEWRPPSSAQGLFGKIYQVGPMLKFLDSSP